MENLLTSLLRASVYGGVVIAVILPLRLVLRKAPKKYICLLWLLAALRLLMPFALQSSLSLQPQWDPSPLPLTGSANPQQNTPQTPTSSLPADSLPSQGGTVIEPGTNTQPDTNPQPGTSEPLVSPEAPALSARQVLFWVWLAGTCGMLLYSGLTYCLLRHRVRDAVILSEGVWVSGRLETAFVLGYFRPGIYLNAGLEPRQRELVLRHEQCHLRRGDHWWKLLGYGTLALHWFNPLVWIGYLCLCRDLEMACDEAVVRHMDVAQRKAYSAALLGCGVRHRSIAACPVAFGEVSVKARIKNVLYYKKPSFWIILAVIISVIVVGIFLLPDPVTKEPLEICREAVQKLQTSDSFVIRQQIDDPDPNSMPAYESAEFWRNGDNWYSCYIDRDAVTEYLHFDGRWFFRQTTQAMPPEDILYPEWTELHEEPTDPLAQYHPMKDIQFEEMTFAFLQATGDSEYTFLVNDRFTWRFGIDNGGDTLTSVNISYEEGAYAHTNSINIAYPGTESVAQVLQRYFQEATAHKESGNALSANDRQMLKVCQLALERLYAYHGAHIVIDTTMQGYPAQNGSSVEFWKWKDSWLLSYEVDLASGIGMEDYTIGNLLLDGIQYRYGHAGTSADDREWTVATEQQQTTEPWVLRKALLMENVTVLFTKYNADSMEITLYFDGPPRGGYDEDWYGCVQTWYLDLDWNLLRVTETATRKHVDNGVTYYPMITKNIQILDTNKEEITAVLEAAKAEVQEDIP